jgi:hypothetical protein
MMLWEGYKQRDLKTREKGEKGEKRIHKDSIFIVKMAINILRKMIIYMVIYINHGY